MIRAALLALLALTAAPVSAVTLGVEDPTVRVECVKVVSMRLFKQTTFWAGYPNWKSGGKLYPISYPACPASQGNWIDVPTVPETNYVITISLSYSEPDGTLRETKILPPYFHFSGPAQVTRPRGVTFL